MSNTLQTEFNELTRTQKTVLAIRLTLSMAGEVNDDVKHVIGRMVTNPKEREALKEYFSEKFLQEVGI